MRTSGPQPLFGGILWGFPVTITIYRGFRFSWACALLAVFLSLANVSALAADALDRFITLDIPPNTPLDDALIEWGTKVGMTVMVNTPTVEHQTTQGVHGTLRAGAMLSALLRDSGLSYTAEGGRMIRVAPVGTLVRSSEREKQKELSARSDSDLAYSGADVISTDQRQDNPGQVTESAKGSANIRQLEEVTVTAQKKAENLLDVPVPVAVINAAALTAQSQLQFQDYFSNAPGLNFSSGDRGEMFPNIRGINTGNYTSPTVGIVVDDVAYGSSVALEGSSAAPNINPSDLARIEVLRGPQGTLYGANSLGGLIKFVTVDPSTAGFTGNVAAGASAVHSGAQAGYNFNGAVNVPITNDLAVRASAYAQQLPGYISNPVTGARGINETDMEGGHFAALWKPSDVFSLKLSALIQHLETDGSNFSAPEGFGALQQDFLIGTGSSTNDAQVFSAVIRAKLGSVDLTSITGYSRVRVTSINDASNFDAGATEQYFGVGGAALHETVTTDKYTQEIRLSSSIGANFDWLVGGYWTRENTGQDDIAEAVDPPTGAGVGQYGTLGSTAPYQEYAAFADLTFHFSDRFNIQVGGRQSHDRIYSELQSVTGPWAAIFSPAPVFIARSLADTENPFTWQVTPQFKLNPDVMMYARVATGFRPGAGNPAASVALGAPPASDPDKTINYELGAKGEVFEHLLSFDASVYYIDWKQIQIALETPEGAGYSTNGAGAKSQGVDLSAQLRPADGLNIGGWLSLDDAKLTQAFPPTGAYGQPGDVLPYVSRISGNLSADQSFPLWGEVAGQIGGLVTYVGHREGNFTGSAVRQDFGGYARLDLHTSATYRAWKFNLFANNIADRRGIIGGGLDSYHTGDPLIYITPRTVGFLVERKW
jgi:iron complex outermembrane recepter protein